MGEGQNENNKSDFSIRGFLGQEIISSPKSDIEQEKVN
jgi:hypothetical protein